MRRDLFAGIYILFLVQCAASPSERNRSENGRARIPRQTRCAPFFTFHSTIRRRPRMAVVRNPRRVSDGVNSWWTTARTSVESIVLFFL